MRIIHVIGTSIFAWDDAVWHYLFQNVRGNAGVDLNLFGGHRIQKGPDGTVKYRRYTRHVEENDLVRNFGIVLLHCLDQRLEERDDAPDGSIHDASIDPGGICHVREACDGLSTLFAGVPHFGKMPLKIPNVEPNPFLLGEVVAIATAEEVTEALKQDRLAQTIAADKYSHPKALVALQIAWID